jgi:hypothetical protein
LAEFFDNKWRNARMEKELMKCKSLSEKRALAGLKGAWAKHKGPTDNVWQLPPQSHSHIEILAKRLTEKKK